MVIPSNERFVHAFAKRDSLSALVHLLPLAPAECVDHMLEYLAAQLIERTIIDVNDHAPISAESRALAQERAEDEERKYQMKSDSTRPSPFKRIPRSVLGKRETALTVAVKTRHAQFTRVLCAQNGVHVDQVNCGTEPLLSHPHNGGLDGGVLTPLAQESTKEIRVFPIVIALENNDVEIVQTLIDHGVQVQQHQNLVITASNGYPECLDAVLKAHKRLKGLAGEGLFWLRRRVEKKTGRQIRLPRGMLEDVILPYVIPEQEFSQKEMGNALLCAASCGNTQCVKILLDARADPSFFEEMSRASILMWAAETGAKDAIQLLLDYHADPDAEDVQSMSALDYAALYGYDDLVDLLRKHCGANGQSQILPIALQAASRLEFRTRWIGKQVPDTTSLQCRVRQQKIMGTGAGRSTEEEKRAITVSRELEDERRKEEEKWNKEQEKQAERELKEAEERQKKEEARLRIYNIEMITPYLSSPL